MLKKYIGTKQFYSGVIFVAAPIIVQNVITNFVSLLDNVMVGQVGTEQMSGVAIVNQLLFVFNLGIWGITSGAGVLGTQYFGKKDYEGVAHSLRFKLVFTLVYTLAGLALFLFFGDDLIYLFLHESEDGLDLAATFEYAKQYIKVILWGLPFFVLTQNYASTLREIKETKVPMTASISAVLINFVFNYLLIYGKLGFPELGIIGAAIATNMSRIAEAAICVLWTHKHPDKAAFISLVYGGTKMPKELMKKAIVLTIPAFINEFLWASGQTILNQSMSLRGIAVVSAINISSMVTQVCKSVFLSIGISIAIMVGNALGAGDKELAVDTDRKMIFMSFVLTVVLGVIMFFVAPLIPRIYNTTEDVRFIATRFIQISSILMPVEAIINACYHTIKSGGRILVTFLYDGGYTWVVSVPIAFCLAHFTNMNIIPMYACIFGINIIKLTAGLILVSKKIWVRTLVENKEE